MSPSTVATKSGAFAKFAALSFGKPAPDSETLVVCESVVEAVGAHFAGTTDLFGLPSGSALFGKECLRIGLGAERVCLPGQNVIVAGGLPYARYSKGYGVYEPVIRNATPNRRPRVVEWGCGAVFAVAHVGYPIHARPGGTMRY